MKELLSIQPQTMGTEQMQTVNARDLHAFLEVGKDFSTWVKDRIQQHGVLENHDFVFVEGLSSPNLGSSKSRAQQTIEYHLTVEAAKHIAMAEHTPRGKEARDYFIECERVARSVMVPALPAPEPGVYKVLLASTDEDDFWKTAVKCHKRLQRFPFMRQNAVGFLLAFRLSLECAAQKVGTNPRHFVPFFDQLPALPSARAPDQIAAKPGNTTVPSTIGDTGWAEVLAMPLTVGGDRPVRDLIMAALDGRTEALAILACHGIAFPYLSLRDRGSTRCLFVANPAEKIVTERSRVVRELHSLITRANGRPPHHARVNVHGGRARGVVIPLDILPLDADSTR